MILDSVRKASDDIWNYAITGNLNRCYRGFREIKKLEDMLRTYGYKFSRSFHDGGQTIIFMDDNGKRLGTARENCFSDGAAMDLIEVFGLYGEKSDNFLGFLDANEVFSLFMNSSRKYKADLRCKAEG